jgi:hypothetical protein
MIEAGRRMRNQPAPPTIVFESLTEPNRDRNRQWLRLVDDEVRPEVPQAEQPRSVVWSSWWSNRSDARIRFDPPSDGRRGTDLCWSLFVVEPMPEASLLGHMRKRVNSMINANRRYTFGQ